MYEGYWDDEAHRHEGADLAAARLGQAQPLTALVDDEERAAEDRYIAVAEGTGPGSDGDGDL